MSNELITALQSAAGNVSSGFYSYTVDNSARFDGSSYLSKTFTTPTDSKKYTFSAWLKLTDLNKTLPVIFSAVGVAGSWEEYIGTYINVFRIYNGGGSPYLVDTAVRRDSSSWYHLHIKVDTTQATASDRMVMTVNGTPITVSSSSYPSQNASTVLNSAVAHRIGAIVTISGDYYFEGYMADFVFVDGTAYSATDFGENKNGVWIPKDVSGLTFGNNGFYLDFADSSNLGNDVSGNNNDFTFSGLTSSDQMPDTPTNNFATFNPLDTLNIYNTVILSEGNTRYDSVNSTQVQCTMLPRTGKWYWEVMSPNLWNGVGTTGYRGQVGIKPRSASVYDNSLTVRILMGNGYGANTSGRVSKYTTATYKAGVTNAVDSNDILGIVYDADNLTLEYLINNTSWSVVTGLNDEQCFPWIQGDGTPSTSQNTEWNMNFGNNGDFNGNKTAQGNADENGHGNFYYTPPTGALALCTANLPELTIGPNSDTLSDENFAPILYTGNGTAKGSGGNTINLGVDMTSGKYMVAIKNRDAADSWMVFDTMRGDNKYIEFDSVDPEVTDTETCEFTSTGVKLGNNAAVNTSGEDYVLYWFKATPGFFDIQLRVGTGSAVAHDHDLGVKPNFITTKLRTTYTSNMQAYVDGGQVTDPATDYYELSSSSAVRDNATVWNDTEPTSTQYTVGTGGINVSGEDYVEYLWADLEGFSSIGSYTGNGSTDGPFVYTGFQPAFVIIKTSEQVGNWIVLDTKRDTYNVSKTRLDADLPNVEYAGEDLMDILSNGFKLRTSSASKNPSGQQVIYIAFAENPFKYSNAR